MGESNRLAIFGERLRRLLDKRDMKQKDLAEKLGLNESTVSNYVNGRVPGHETVGRIANFFGVSTDYLYGREDEPRPASCITTYAAARPDDRRQELPPAAKRVIRELEELFCRKYKVDDNDKKE